MSQKKVRFDQFELDYGRFQLSRRGTAVRLESLPMQLLMLLIDNQPTVVDARADCGCNCGARISSSISSRASTPPSARFALPWTMIMFSRVSFAP